VGPATDKTLFLPSSTPTVSLYPSLSSTPSLPSRFPRTFFFFSLSQFQSLIFIPHNHSPLLHALCFLTPLPVLFFFFFFSLSQPLSIYFFNLSFSPVTAPSLSPSNYFLLLLLLLFQLGCEFDSSVYPLGYLICTRVEDGDLFFFYEIIVFIVKCVLGILEFRSWWLLINNTLFTMMCTSMWVCVPDKFEGNYICGYHASSSSFNVFVCVVGHYWKFYFILWIYCDFDFFRLCRINILQGAWAADFFYPIVVAMDKLLFFFWSIIGVSNCGCLSCFYYFRSRLWDFEVHEEAIYCPVTVARHWFVEFYLAFELGYNHEFSARQIC